MSYPATVKGNENVLFDVAFPCFVRTLKSKVGSLQTTLAGKKQKQGYVRYEWESGATDCAM